MRSEVSSEDGLYDFLFMSGFEIKGRIIYPPDSRRSWNDLSENEKGAIDEMCDSYGYIWGGFKII